MPLVNGVGQRWWDVTSKIWWPEGYSFCLVRPPLFPLSETSSRGVSSFRERLTWWERLSRAKLQWGPEPAHNYMARLSDPLSVQLWDATATGTRSLEPWKYPERENEAKSDPYSWLKNKEIMFLILQFWGRFCMAIDNSYTSYISTSKHHNCSNFKLTSMISQYSAQQLAMEVLNKCWLCD